MKTLRFSYEMKLTMSQDVREHHFLIRCIPMENSRQRLLDFHCGVIPEAVCYRTEDGFGNRGLAGLIAPPHGSLCVKAEGLVRTGGGPDAGGLHPMYSFPSACTQPDAALSAFFAESKAAFQPGISVLEKSLVLMDRLYGRFVYEPGVTNTKTTAAEAFALGRGVCQDYAHILISLCRLASIPARYAAGMMAGEGETHAWAEVWTGDGWVGLDPTHNCLVEEHYIKLTHGRDFVDATVDRGCFLGYAEQKAKIYVKVGEAGDD